MARTSKNKKSDDSFEARLAELEDLVDQLETGDLPLEKAVQTFEEGMSLARQLNEVLEKAERRIEVLMTKESGEASLKPYNPKLEEDEE